MWKLKSYLLPANDYSSISFEEALIFGDLVESICKKDSLIIPQEFYSYPDKNEISATEYLFKQEMDDVSQYLFDIVTKQLASVNDYRELVEKISQFQGSFTRLVNKVDMDGIDNYLIETENDIVKIKRTYIALVDNYEDFKDRAIDCYPDLIFHTEAFTSIHKLGNISVVIDELMRHLSVLCDKGKDLYIKNENNEKATLDNLKSEFNITCSGKGSNEKLDYNKKIVIRKLIKENGVEKEAEIDFVLTCNPHTKFFDGYNDQRIYFCWGRTEIRNHDIIIIRVGDHWK